MRRQLDRACGLLQTSVIVYPKHPRQSLSLCCERSAQRQTLEGMLRIYDDTGLEQSTSSIELAPHGRYEETLSQSFQASRTPGYAVLEFTSGSAVGYLKVVQQGVCRAAVPASLTPAKGDIFLSHIASKDQSWWTKLSLLNTTEMAKNLTIDFNDSRSVTVNLAPSERKSFSISELFEGNAQENLTSATIRNAAGVVGVELFGWLDQLASIPISDSTSDSLYYPHVAGYQDWWTVWWHTILPRRLWNSP